MIPKQVRLQAIEQIDLDALVGPEKRVEGEFGRQTIATDLSADEEKEKWHATAKERRGCRREGKTVAAFPQPDARENGMGRGRYPICADKQERQNP